MLLAFKKHVTVPGSGVTGPTMQPGRPWVVRSWSGRGASSSQGLCLFPTMNIYY